jgi:hypothetical protein
MRPLSRRVLMLAAALAVVALSAAWNEAVRPIAGPHSRLELALLRAEGDLPVQFSTHFVTSGRCAGCHGHDPDGVASVDSQGRDVNLADDWRSTMMANSARDPFFRAKARHESLMYPGHATSIQNKCLGCHAPLGMHEEEWLGHAPFTLAHLDTSVLGNDGVSCLSCHMQRRATAGSFFSGQLQFDSARVYGPYADDMINPAIMQFFVRFTPGFGEHIVNSKVCAGCHTLITQTLDHEGNSTGDEFVEQATYHEWLNSVYSSNGTACNSCHMPRLNEPIVLAAGYAALAPQQPFGQHHLVGGNTTMLKLLKANRQALGIPATDAQFDSTIARTERLLAHATLHATLLAEDRSADTAYYALRLENRAGHKFPSGYPSRRAFIEFTVLDAVGDTVFSSGRLNSAYEVEGHDAGYEPHYDIISRGDQVQIYELVMGDVNGDPTTVLERAKDALKDNRLVPVGFSTQHSAYDTTRIAGVPASDTDFNRDALGNEGSGTDIVRYRVPLNGHGGTLRAFARVYYQPVPPAWNAELFSTSHPEIDAFRDMLEASDRAPVLVAADSVQMGPLGLPAPAGERVRIAPNPAPDGWVGIVAEGAARVELLAVYDARGARVEVPRQRVGPNWLLRLPDAPGTYLLHLRVDGTDAVKRVLRP